MNLDRILRNDIIIMTGHRNEGKTMTLCNVMLQYLTGYTGNVCTFGIQAGIVKKLSKIRPVKLFWSIREMEKIQNSLIIADEAGDLLNVINRKQHENMLKTLRAVAHQNNIILLCSLPFDFKKIFSAQARCFLYKGLNIQELINGSLIKATLQEYKGHELGAYRLNIPKGKLLCHDEGGFWTESVQYYPGLDTKRDNENLLERKE